MELEEGHQRREAQELDANHGTVRLDEVDLYLGKMAKRSSSTPRRPPSSLSCPPRPRPDAVAAARQLLVQPLELHNAAAGAPPCAAYDSVDA